MSHERTFYPTPAERDPAPVPPGEDPKTYRAERLGASEFAAALGFGKYTSPLALQLRKRGELAPRPAGGAADLGLVVEPYIAQWFARTYPQVVTVLYRPDSVRHPSGRLLASPDALAVFPDRHAGLECKWRSEFLKREWGERGTDEVPADVFLQCYGGMLCTGYREWHVAVLFGTGGDTGIYTVRWDETLGREIERRALEYVERYLLGSESAPIDAHPATAAALAAKHPQFVGEKRCAPATEAESQAAAALTLARWRLDEWQQYADRAMNVLKAAIGDRYGVSSPEFTASWSNVQYKPTTDWEAVARALAEHAPVEAFDALVATHQRTRTPSRQFRFTPKFKELERYVRDEKFRSLFPGYWVDLPGFDPALLAQPPGTRTGGDGPAAGGA